MIEICKISFCEEVLVGEEVGGFCFTAVKWIVLFFLSFYLQTGDLRFINIRVRRVNVNVKIIFWLALVSLIYLQFLLIIISCCWFSVSCVILRTFFGSFPFHPPVLKPNLDLES